MAERLYPIGILRGEEGVVQGGGDGGGGEGVDGIPSVLLYMQLAKRDTIEDAKLMLNVMIEKYERIYGRCSTMDDVTARLIRL